MSLIFLIEAIEEVKQTLNAVAAALCHDEDVKIAQSEQKKTEIKIEFSAAIERLTRLIEGDPVPNITEKEAEKPDEDLSDAA
jgi:hypothetical protein